MVMSPVEDQSMGLTDILDMYLDEIVGDATSRGVMSSNLSRFLNEETPDAETLETEEGEDEIVVETNMKGVRFVSIVRRALRD